MVTVALLLWVAPPGSQELEWWRRDYRGRTIARPYFSAPMGMKWMYLKFHLPQGKFKIYS